MGTDETGRKNASQLLLCSHIKGFKDWQKCPTQCTSNPGYPESNLVEFIQASLGGLDTKSASDFSSGKQNKRTVFMQHLLPHSPMVIKQFYNSANSVT